MTSASPPSSRLVELDALRGLAALSVVLFHYTTRFSELYGPVSPMVAFPQGHHGVNLFFIISGFVIFMTLERSRTAMDFAVSRFSRLFPAYWICLGLTFALTHWFGLPGKLVDGTTAAANALMFHGLFGFAHVDGVYWTLEVELLFYCGMLALFWLGRLDRVHRIVWLLLALRWLYFMAQQGFGVDLPWVVYRLLILKYLPWFALGLAAYSWLHGGHSSRRAREAAITAAAAVLTLGVIDSPLLGALALALFCLVCLAAANRIRVLKLKSLAWLGSISYPLYLLHEYIGWSLMIWGLKLAIPIDLLIVAVILLILAMSQAVSRFVERPAMAWIRARYRGRKVMSAASGVPR